MMGIFSKFGAWIDKGIAKVVGTPTIKPRPLPKIVTAKPIISARKALLEERHKLFVEDAPIWQRRLRAAINKHREEGMSEEELIERYGDEYE